jgi:putative copper export protein
VLLKLALVVTALAAAGLPLASLAVLASEQDARRPLQLAGGLALAAAALAALRLAADAAALAGGWSSVFEPPYLAWTFRAQGSFAALLTAGAALIVAGILAGRRLVAAIGSLAVIFAFTTTGHLSAADGPLWLRAALAVHLLGVAVWITAPALLWPRRTVSDAALRARVEAFGRIAVVLIPLALAAGGLLAAALLGEPSALTDSGYGRMILVKVTAAAGALALGAANKLWIARKLAAHPERGRSLLRLTLGADAALFCLAFTAVAAATTVLPPES